MSFGPLWPRSLAGRTLLLLLATALLVYAGGITGFRLLARNASDTEQVARLAGRLETAMQELSGLPVTERDEAAAALSSPRFRIHWSATPPAENAAHNAEDAQHVRAQLAARLQQPDIRLRHEGASLLGSVRLEDGSYAVFSAALVPSAIPNIAAPLLIGSLVFASTTIVAILVLRMINAPLRRLADAADRFGDQQWAPLPEQGPFEIVQVQRAFNAMGRRIHRLITDRTQALAAVSHDLRTPISRLRLRCGLLPDAEMRAEWERDLAEMEMMIESTLAFLRGDEDAEEPRLTDLASLLTTLVDAAADAGHRAQLSAPRHCNVMVRPVGVKRAFANLIDNAIMYGGCARVALHGDGRNVRVVIDDDGPGIPDADLQHVFEPFRRLEASRNRSTGGVGLGLAIAHRVFERESGSIRLSNRREGGLRAEVLLPSA
jgi:signal transduction histidine kinase